MLYGSYLETAAPAQGRTLEELRQFLARMDLRYDDGVEFTALLRDGEGQILATASLQGGVVKCVAVDPAQQGEGLTATVLTGRPWPGDSGICSSTPSPEIWPSSRAWASPPWRRQTGCC